MKATKGTKLIAGVVAAPAVYFAGSAAGDAAGVAPGWKRGALGAVLAGVFYFIAGSLKATKGLAGSIATGGAAGAVALMFEPQLKSFLAARAAAAPPGYQEFGMPAPPQIPAPAPAPVIVQQEAPAREPTTLEQLAPIFGGVFQMFGNIFGSSPGSGSAFRRLAMGSGSTYRQPFGAGARLGLYEATRN